MAKVSDQRCSLQLVFLSTPSKSTSLALSLLVAHINWGGRASTCFKHFNLCGFVAVMGENSWWRHSRFYTFRSLWVHSRLPYVLLRPRASVEILRMDFTKKWRGLWLIHFSQNIISMQWCLNFPQCCFFLIADWTFCRIFNANSVVISRRKLADFSIHLNPSIR